MQETLKNNIKKVDLIKSLSQKTGYSQLISKKIFADLIYLLIYSIKNTGNLNLKNFGSFNLINKLERVGRNPKTKKEFIISSRKYIKFTTSKKLLEKLNKLI